jgi:hypothetical protein
MMPMDDEKPSPIASFFEGVFSVIHILSVGGIILMFVCIIITLLLTPSSSYDRVDATRIVNDLRQLKGAAELFQRDIGRWPVPGEEASLDLYSDRPIAGANPPRYANVMLSGEIHNSDGTARQFAGVELIPEKTGTEGIQQAIARKTQKQHARLFQEIPSRDAPPAPYQSGLSVYMEIR